MTLWEQGQVKTTGEAAKKFLQGSWHTGTGDAARWADENCQRLGEQPAVYHEYLRPTTSLILCRFADNSAIETWTLLSGPDYYPRLAALIKPAS
ncbi:MAG: hypothetical protein M3Q07_12540 [Pseudobdellovibrionaceae bacterium]|nr:hypothetical protein [Pseudobdellovibrionaceae bacterium]